MAFAKTTYPGRGGNINTQAGWGAGPGGGGGPDMSWLWDLAQRRAQESLKQQGLQTQLQRQQLDDARQGSKDAYSNRMQSRFGGPRRPGRNIQDAAGEAENMARIAAARTQFGTAGFGGAPLRTVSGPGVIPGQTMDSMRMTGAQRQAFLPQNAQGGSLGFESTPSGMRAGTRAVARGQQLADAEGIQGMAEMMAGARPGFGMGGRGQMRATPGRTSQGWPVRQAPQE